MVGNEGLREKEEEEEGDLYQYKWGRREVAKKEQQRMHRGERERD